MTHTAASARPPSDARRFACELTSLALLRVSGADATNFLQGQLTNDISALAVGGAQRSGYCSPKGRLLADFLIMRTADSLWLIIDRTLADTIRKRLSMFVLRAKVRIELADESLRLFGFVDRSISLSEQPSPIPLGPSAIGWPAPMVVADDQPMLRLGLDPVSRADPPWHRMIAVLGTDQAAGLIDGGLEDWPLVSEAWWQTGEVLVGTPHITAATTDAFVPQMVNFELVGGVDFRKGCYTGQEVVARTQYLGKLKRRMGLGWMPGAAAPGDALNDAQGQPAGVVVAAGPGDPVGRPGEFALLFERRIDDSPASLTLGGLPITPGALPYDIPVVERFERPRDL